MDEPLRGNQPILCAPVIRQVDARLIELLTELRAEEWDLPTVAPHWTVRDVAAHLLDTALRKLSLGRDRCRVERVEIHTHADVIALVNRLNREGVTVYRRLSPPVLIQIMRMACAQTAEYYESLEPLATANIGVSWAGEMTSLNWFDTARELTERWHHQQQIRLATERPGIMTPELYAPVLDTFLRGLPYALRAVQAVQGAVLLVEVAGECGGRWCLRRSGGDWEFTDTLPALITASVSIPQEIAWRLFTKGIDRNAARPLLAFAGDRALAEHVLDLVAIVG